MEYLLCIVLGCVIGFLLGNKNTLEKEHRVNIRAEKINENERVIANKQNSNIKKINKLKEEIEKKEIEIYQYSSAWKDQHNRLMSETVKLNQSFNDGYIQGREWLAKAYSEYIKIKDFELQCSLVVKPNPAIKAAEAINEISKSRVEMAYKLKLLEYQLSTYEEYFPILVDYRESILDEITNLSSKAEKKLENIDPALSLGYISKIDFENLEENEKYQLALDRYWQKNKSNAHIGRVYERYIGYLYEKDGWKVSYYGAIKGFEDFGRDLICEKDGDIHIVQCKCWSKEKEIREKHILQLFGTTVLYKITEKKTAVTPVFIATTDLSNEAALVAKELKIDIRKVSLERYPMIKCNINKSSKEKIYHLPFDQQYDRIAIGGVPNKFYAKTIEEATSAGYRRAFKWTGEKS